MALVFLDRAELGPDGIPGDRAFAVIDGTGRFSGLAGSGTYVFHALYTTARDVRGCTKVMTGYIESIDGTVTLSPSAARAVNAAAG